MASTVDWTVPVGEKDRRYVILDVGSDKLDDRDYFTALFAEVNMRLGRILRANPVIDIPGDVILIARVMGLLSGIGRTLGSETDLLEAIEPYLEPAPPAAETASGL